MFGGCTSGGYAGDCSGQKNAKLSSYVFCFALFCHLYCDLCLFTVLIVFYLFIICDC